MTKPESDEVLLKFYTTVRPWGFWKPIKELALKQNPNFKPNKDFGSDMINVLVGVVWQITLMAAPVFLVIQEYTSLILTVIILVITSIFLKLNWWDKLETRFGENSLSD
jgi:uncharacterized membrane protein